MSFRQQVSENESEIEKLTEAIKKKDEKEKKYQGVILYTHLYIYQIAGFFRRVSSTIEHHCRATS